MILIRVNLLRWNDARRVFFVPNGNVFSVLSIYLNVTLDETNVKFIAS